MFTSKVKSNASLRILPNVLTGGVIIQPPVDNLKAGPASFQAIFFLCHSP